MGITPFIDVCTGEKIAGYDKACQWRIGKTKRQEMVDEMVPGEPRLSFFFSIWRGQELPTNRLMAVFGGEEMRTTRGIEVGDPLSKVEKVYGKPLSRAVCIGIYPGTDEPIIFRGLFYDNLFFLSDRTEKKVGAIMIGSIPLPGLYRPWW